MLSKIQNPFSIRGTPVFVHWSIAALLAFGLFLTLFSNFVVLIGTWSFLATLFIHEYGHYLVARNLHYEVEQIRIYPFRGLCIFEAPQSRSDEIRIASAGPLAQILVALPLLYFYERFEPQSIHINTVIGVLGSYGLLMAIVNLLPLPGFDGETIIRAMRDPAKVKRTRKRSQLRVVSSHRDPKDVVRSALEKLSGKSPPK